MIERREVLQLLLATGGSALLGQTAEAMPGGAAGRMVAEDGAREKVVGIGGVFFRAKDPDALGRWYQEHLGIDLTPTKVDSPEWHTEAGVTLFSPFPENTNYFEAKQMWMLNFRVRDIGRMAAQLKAAGVPVALDPQEYPNGRFARLHDPEGNPIELWQPMERVVAR